MIGLQLEHRLNPVKLQIVCLATPLRVGPVIPVIDPTPFDQNEISRKEGLTSVGNPNGSSRASLALILLCSSLLDRIVAYMSCQQISRM